MKIEPSLLLRVAPRGRPAIVEPVAAAMTEFFPVFGITTLFRAAHFIAQASHETAGFDTLEEYASGRDYEGRLDLGNTEPGDGRRFKGRGIFQLTGRANYARMAKRMSLDLVREPTIAARPRVSTHIACLYWTDKKLNAAADADDVRLVTRRINGGLNGLTDRIKYLVRAKAALAELP